MTETDDIKARLERAIPHAPTYVTATIRDAITHITRLEERCAALEGQVKDGAAEIEWLKIRVQTLAETNFNGVLHSTRDRAEAAEREAAALKEEVGRLREALQAIVNIGVTRGMFAAERVARAALQPPGAEAEQWR